MVFVGDLQSYQDLLGEETAWQNVTSLVPADEAILDELIRFCSLREKALLPCKTAAIQRLFRSFHQRKIIPSMKIRFHLLKAGHAYMLDRGEVHFCRQFLFAMPFEKCVAITLHELAHAYLLGQDGYEALLALDGAFLPNLKTQSQTVIAPVEFYANLIANHWLSLAAARLPQSNRRLALEREWCAVQQKLRAAVDQL